MEGEAALQLFRHSLSQNDLHYTSVICDSYSRVYQTLCEEKPHRFMSILKEDCVNHMKNKNGDSLSHLCKQDKERGATMEKGGLPKSR